MNLKTKIEEALAEIRPYLQIDGGDVEVISVENGIATIKWIGSCASCSKSPMTLNGVSEIIKNTAPEITKIVEI